MVNQSDFNNRKRIVERGYDQVAAEYARLERGVDSMP
jgi:hypothetical protein